MKDIKALEEHARLLEKEMAMVSDDLDRLKARCHELEETKDDLRALLMFLERRYPELMTELPELMRKLKTG